MLVFTDIVFLLQPSIPFLIPRSGIINSSSRSALCNSYDMSLKGEGKIFTLSNTNPMAGAQATILGQEAAWDLLP